MQFFNHYITVQKQSRAKKTSDKNVYDGVDNQTNDNILYSYLGSYLVQILKLCNNRSP